MYQWGTQERIFNCVKNIFRLYKREKIIHRLHERKNCEVMLK